MGNGLITRIEIFGSNSVINSIKNNREVENCLYRDEPMAFDKYSSGTFLDNNDGLAEIVGNILHNEGYNTRNMDFRVEEVYSYPKMYSYKTKNDDLNFSILSINDIGVDKFIENIDMQKRKNIFIIYDEGHYYTLAILKDGNDYRIIHDDSKGTSLFDKNDIFVKINEKLDNKTCISDYCDFCYWRYQTPEQYTDNTCGIRSLVNSLYYALNDNRYLLDKTNGLMDYKLFDAKLPTAYAELQRLYENEKEKMQPILNNGDSKSSYNILLEECKEKFSIIIQDILTYNTANEEYIRYVIEKCEKYNNLMDRIANDLLQRYPSDAEKRNSLLLFYARSNADINLRDIDKNYRKNILNNTNNASYKQNSERNFLFE